MVMPKKTQDERGLKTKRCINPKCDVLNLYTDLDYCSVCKTPFEGDTAQQESEG